MPRCNWADISPEMTTYHDEEWGKPCHDDQKLGELRSLELMQAGLSWQTILAKRQAFREVFYDFDPNKVSQMTETDVKRLLADPRIIRNERKILAIINNAQLVVKLQQQGKSLADLLWQEVDFSPKNNQFTAEKQVPAKTELSESIAKKLKKQGFKFMGPTIVYSLMQASGMVNDHLVGCSEQ